MATIFGRVMIEGGETAIDGVLELHNAAGDVVDQVVVDDSGRYRFHVSEGKWVLKLWDPNGRRGAAEALVAADEDLNLNVSLLREGVG